MDIIEYTENLDSNNPILDKYFDERTVLFDIECLGLSALKYPIYLIGCARRKSDIAEITLFFAENASEEPELLEAFDKYIEDCDTIASFNGANFDEPFIRERMKKYNMQCRLSTKHHLDLYRYILKAKSFLNLDHYKQKSIEEFMGLFREDKYDGGKLISVYKEYEKTGDEELKKLLLLHNYEDVLGMLTVLKACVYVDLLYALPFELSLVNENNAINISGKIALQLPKLVTKTNNLYTYAAKGNSISLTIPVEHITLNTYLSNPKDYVYVIAEDMVVPSVLASTMDKSAYRKATKEDCKIKCEDDFIKINHNIVLPSDTKIFKASYADKSCYIRCSDLTPEILSSIVCFYQKH